MNDFQPETLQHDFDLLPGVVIAEDMRCDANSSSCFFHAAAEANLLSWTDVERAVDLWKSAIDQPSTYSLPVAAPLGSRLL